MDSNSACPMGGRHKHVHDILGEITCRKCGIVLAEKEAVAFSHEDHGTLSEPTSSEPGIKWHWKSDKILKYANSLITQYTQLVSSQKIISSRARKLFTESRKKSRQILKGRDTKTFVAACIHIACREEEIPSSHIIIAKKTNVKKDKLMKFEKHIRNLLEITLPPDKAIKKVRYVASKVGLPENISRKAAKILDQIPSQQTGPNPTGIAAAVLYLVCENTKHSVTYNQLADAISMNHQTVGNSVKRLRKDIKKYL